MTGTLRHADVRIDDAHAPCPFCGCGLVSAPARAPKRTARGHHGRVTYRGPAVTFEQLPPEWRRYMRSTMKPDEAAARATKALNDSIKAKEAAGLALVVEKTRDGQGIAPKWVRATDGAEVAA